MGLGFARSSDSGLDAILTQTGRVAIAQHWQQLRALEQSAKHLKLAPESR